MKLILDKGFKLNDQEINSLENLGYKVKYYNKEECDGDVFVGMLRAPFSEIDNIKGLKYIQSTIVGYENIDLDKLKAKGITYANASGVSSSAIAEYVVLKILDYYKQSAKFREQQKNKYWGTHARNSVDILEVENKRVLVLGTGSIAKEVAKRLKAFNAIMIGINRSGKAVEHFDEVYPLSEVYNNLNDVDVVVGAIPLNKETTNLYDDKFFDNMQDNAVFINIGRGKSVDEKALINALDKLGHVYLDVTKNEPLEEDSLLWSHPKVSITPHISASSNLVKMRTKNLVFKNLENYIKEKPLMNKVI